MIEKKRRDRINQCLSELKRLVPTAFEKQGSAKLEKAEILKMTVDHLKLIQTNQKINSSISDQNLISSDLKREGFRECVSEVTRYLVTFEGLDPQNPLCVRLLNHLHHYHHHSHHHHHHHHQGSTHSSSLPSSMPQLPATTSAFSQISQRLDYWNPPTSRRYLDTRNISNSKPLNSASLVTSYFPPTSTILPYAANHHHQYYGNWPESERNTLAGKSDILIQTYSGSTDGNSQQSERKDTGGFNLLTGVLNPSDLGRPTLTPTTTFDNSFSHSQLLHYLKPYRPWGTELALY